MAFFEVKTKTVFENIYLVEASSIDEAAQRALDINNDKNYFVQKHVNETVLEVSNAEGYSFSDYSWIYLKAKDGYE